MSPNPEDASLIWDSIFLNKLTLILKSDAEVVSIGINEASLWYKMWNWGENLKKGWWISTIRRDYERDYEKLVADGGRVSSIVMEG